MTRPKSATGMGWEPPADVELDGRARRAILEPLAAPTVSTRHLIRDIEVILSVAMSSHDAPPNTAGRRRLLDELIAAAGRFERALLDLDAASWDELARDVDREQVDLPDGFERFLMCRGASKFFEQLVGRGYPRMPPPIAPAALTEIARAAREQRGRLTNAEARGKRRLATRDGAVKRLAGLFHWHTASGVDYRGRLIDFVAAALRAAKLPVPESEEKVLALVPPGFRRMRKGPPKAPARRSILAELLARTKEIR